MKVVDFRNHRHGTLVRRSAHWFKSRCVPKKHPDRTQRGIVTGVVFYEDGSGQMIPYPLVFWEGQVMASVTHPANVFPARKVPITYIETDGG